MRIRLVVLLVTVMMIVTGCSLTTTTATTFGVDDAPQLVKSTFLTVIRRSATLAGYEASNEEWMDFAREVCAAGIDSSEELVEFVDDQAGSDDPLIKQMWSTAADAATSSFCSIGRT